MLAVAFAALISSCDNASEKKASSPAEVYGVLDANSEDLLGRTKITAAAGEAMYEKEHGRHLDCIVTLSDLNTEKRYYKVGVPLSGGTYAERKKEAESPESRKKLIDCYKAFKIDVPPQLLGANEEIPVRKQSLLGVGAARAQNGTTTCPGPNGKSCGVASTPPDCCM